MLPPREVVPLVKRRAIVVPFSIFNVGNEYGMDDEVDDDEVDDKVDDDDENVLNPF